MTVAALSSSKNETEDARKRLAQTFRFLKELNELRNPIPRDISDFDPLKIDGWPNHPCVIVSRGDRAEEDESESVGAEIEPTIRVQRAPLTPCPKPPDALDGWLRPDWNDPEVEADVIPLRNFPDKAKGSFTVDFEADEQRVTALTSWKAARSRWAAAEQPAIAARRVFERVHTLWTTMQREGDRKELVLADGILSIPQHFVNYPVLMQRVGLVFDPSIPEFRFTPGTDRVELHRSLLRLVPGVAAQMISVLDKELEDAPVEPLGGESTSQYLKRLVQGLFVTDGEFLEKKKNTKPLHPCIWREPVLFLRSRTAGLSSTLENIIEDLDDPQTKIPIGLCRIVGVAAEDELEPTYDAPGEQRRAETGAPPDILFSKPANAEQFEIARRLAKAKAVLVQGPPGTGKTHTIANLLGYLLSQGKTVLVTAHTTKALRVLRQQVDEVLQALCLSVLDSDTESQAQLKHAAQQIADRLSGSDSGTLRREAGILREKRLKLFELATGLRRQLRDARFSEVDEVVINGEGMPPIEVAKRLRTDEAIDGWLPGPIIGTGPCPLSEMDMRQLYASQDVVSPCDEAELSVPQPLLTDLVTPADFRLLTAEQVGAGTRAQAHRTDLWQDGGTAISSEALRQLHQNVKASVSVLSEEQSWLREVLFAGWTGGDLKESWNDLVEVAEALASEAGTAHRFITAHGPELPSNRPVEEISPLLDDIVNFIESGGSLGFRTKITRRKWHDLLEECRVEEREPRNIEEYKALRAKAHLEAGRKRFCSRWRRSIESLGGPSVDSLGSSPERTAQAYAAEIKGRLEWRIKVWEPLISKLCAAGFFWDKWVEAYPPVPGDHGELARIQRAGSQGLAEVVEAKAALLRQAELSAALQTQRTLLAGFPQSELASLLLQAQDTWNAEDYEKVCRELSRLEGLREVYERRIELLTRLEKVAPSWAKAIEQRAGTHAAANPPGDANAAWRWQQWKQELERRARVSIPELQERLERTEDDLRQVAAQIIEQETWAAQIERTALKAQQALMGFVQTIRKLGKRTGNRERIGMLLREARNLLNTARGAVPVWIMPLNRVYESFDPRQRRPNGKKLFDVVIIDEASQSDVTALAALYLGDEHIVVGDKEQVTPDAIGQRVDEVQRLIASDLQGIPNSHLYDGQTSIYDIAETAFGGVVALREHFRCVPEIIQFCNQLSYSRTIRPLREPLSAGLRPALIAHRVNGFRDSGGKRNHVEAEEIASLTMACLDDPEYAVNEFGRPTSFGVISLLGDEQALLIEKMLRQRIPPDVFEKHRLLCGNAAQFQGDERDVVFLSMVDGPPEDGQLSYRDAGPKDVYKKRYNVAVSRARNQLWVVHSVDPTTHLQNGDLRQRLISHARDPQALLRAMEEEGRKTDSLFERLVLERLIAANYRVVPQYQVGAFRIDLVVQGTSGQLAVECDGERWHTADQLQRDLEREAILARLGWRFVRIRGSLFFRDPDAAMAPVFAKISRLGLEPLGNVPPVSASEPTVERIKRKAESLRSEWTEAEAATSLDTLLEEEAHHPMSGNQDYLFD